MPPKIKNNNGVSYQILDNDVMLRLPEKTGALELTPEQYKKGYEQLKACLFAESDLSITDGLGVDRLFYFEDGEIRPVSHDVLNDEAEKNNLVDLAVANRLIAYRPGGYDGAQVTMELKGDDFEFQFNTPSDRTNVKRSDSPLYYTNRGEQYRSYNHFLNRADGKEELDAYGKTKPTLSREDAAIIRKGEPEFTGFMSFMHTLFGWLGAYVKEFNEHKEYEDAVKRQAMYSSEDPNEIKKAQEDFKNRYRKTVNNSFEDELKASNESRYKQVTTKGLSKKDESRGKKETSIAYWKHEADTYTPEKQEKRHLLGDNYKNTLNSDAMQALKYVIADIYSKHGITEAKMRASNGNEPGDHIDGETIIREHDIGKNIAHSGPEAMAQKEIGTILPMAPNNKNYHGLTVLGRKEVDQQKKLINEMQKERTEAVEEKIDFGQRLSERLDAKKKIEDEAAARFAKLQNEASKDGDKTAESIRALITESIEKNPFTTEGAISLKTAIKLFDSFPDKEKYDSLDELDRYFKAFRKTEKVLNEGMDAEIELLQAAAEKKEPEKEAAVKKINALAFTHYLKEHMDSFTDAEINEDTLLPKALTSEKCFLNGQYNDKTIDRYQTKSLKSLDMDKLYDLSVGDLLQELEKPFNLKKAAVVKKQLDPELLKKTENCLKTVQKIENDAREAVTGLIPFDPNQPIPAYNSKEFIRYAQEHLEPEKTVEAIRDLFTDAFRLNPASPAGAAKLKAGIELYGLFKDPKIEKILNEDGSEKQLIQSEKLPEIRPYVMGAQNLQALIAQGRDAEIKLLRSASGEAKVSEAEKNQAIDCLAVKRDITGRLCLYTNVRKDETTKLPSVFSDKNSFVSTLCDMSKSDPEALHETNAEVVRRSFLKAFDADKLHSLSEKDAVETMGNATDLMEFKKADYIFAVQAELKKADRKNERAHLYFKSDVSEVEEYDLYSDTPENLKERIGEIEKIPENDRSETVKIQKEVLEAKLMYFEEPDKLVKAWKEELAKKEAEEKKKTSSEREL